MEGKKETHREKEADTYKEKSRRNTKRGERRERKTFKERCIQRSPLVLPVCPAAKNTLA